MWDGHGRHAHGSIPAPAHDAACRGAGARLYLKQKPSQDRPGCREADAWLCECRWWATSLALGIDDTHTALSPHQLSSLQWSWGMALLGTENLISTETLALEVQVVGDKFGMGMDDTHMAMEHGCAWTVTLSLQKP